MSSEQKEIISFKDFEADVVIVGGGGAGLAAARAAAENGAKVVVLEKRGVGGSSAMAFGIFATESPVQKRMNINTCNDDFFKEAMEFAHWRINPRIVRAVIEKSGDTIRWLEEKGLEFKCLPYWHLPDQKIPTWHVPPGRGAELIKSLVQTCKAMEVQILTQSPAKKILTAENGSITGVLAENKGHEFIVKAKSIIIATGGFAGNQELLKKYCPDYHDNMQSNGASNMGDGLLMATGLGAGTEGLGYLMLGGPIGLGSFPVAINTKQMFINIASVTDSRTLWVNKSGQRFIDESIAHNHWMSAQAIARQPAACCYTIMDSKLAETLASEQEQVPAGNLPNHRRGRARSFSDETGPKSDPLLISNSWEEIARWMGAEPRVLKSTLDEYNFACDNGRDSIFKKPQKYLLPLRMAPYYVLRWSPTFTNTNGGIKVNEHFEVLNYRDQPIPGLFAAGVDTGGWTSETYFINHTGFAFGYAVNSGRMAGESSAEYVKSAGK